MPSFRRVLSARANPAQVDQPNAGGFPRFVQTEGGLTWLSQSTPGLPVVTDDTALTVGALYRSTVLVASTIASFPPRVFDEADDLSRTPVKDQSLAFLWGRPNPEVPSMVFWETVIGHEFLNGNAFIYVARNGLGMPAQLWPIMPHRVRIGRASDGTKVYIIDNNKDAPLVDYVAGGNIMHVPAFGRDGLRGLSLVRLMAESLALAKGATAYNAQMLAKGTALTGVLETDSDMEQDEADALLASWQKRKGGLENAGGVAVLTNGLKWRGISLGPADLQLLETLNFQVLEVSRFTGIPGYMLDPSLTSTWGTGIAEQNRGLITYVLNPHKTRFEQTVSDELISKGNRKFEFDGSALLRGNMKDQVEAAGSLVRAGFDPASALKAVGLAPIEHTGTIPVTVREVSTGP